MSRMTSLPSKIVRIGGQAFSKVVLPNSIDDTPCRKWIGRICNPICELRSAAARIICEEMGLFALQIRRK